MLKLLSRSTESHSSRPDRLTAGYAELQNVDQALRDAEHKLAAAHRRYASRQGPRPDGLYREVVLLRQRSRRLLHDLGDLFLAGDSRPSRLLP